MAKEQTEKWIRTLKNHKKVEPHWISFAVDILARQKGTKGTIKVFCGVLPEFHRGLQERAGVTGDLRAGEYHYSFCRIAGFFEQEDVGGVIRSDPSLEKQVIQALRPFLWEPLSGEDLGRDAKKKVDESSRHYAEESVEVLYSLGTRKAKTEIRRYLKNGKFSDEANQKLGKLEEKTREEKERKAAKSSEDPFKILKYSKERNVHEISAAVKELEMKRGRKKEIAALFLDLLPKIYAIHENWDIPYERTYCHIMGSTINWLGRKDIAKIIRNDPELNSKAVGIMKDFMHKPPTDWDCAAVLGTYWETGYRAMRTLIEIGTDETLGAVLYFLKNSTIWKEVVECAEKGETVEFFKDLRKKIMQEKGRHKDKGVLSSYEHMTALKDIDRDRLTVRKPAPGAENIVRVKRARV